MARSAYRRALRLREGRARVVGIGCTASIATDRPKRGQHRCHVAAWSSEGLRSHSLEMVKGLRDRRGEDAVVSRLVIRALAEAMGVDAEMDLELRESEGIDVRTVVYPDPLMALLAGHVGSITIAPDGSMAADRGFQGGLLAGSFDPLHRGHEKLAEAAANILDAEVAFELSVENVDKPPLDESEVRTRTAQFAGKAPRGRDPGQDLHREGPALSRMYLRDRIRHRGAPIRAALLRRRDGPDADRPGRDAQPRDGLPGSGALRRRCLSHPGRRRRSAGIRGDAGAHRGVRVSFRSVVDGPALAGRRA